MTSIAGKVFIGKEAQSKQGILHVENPVVNGVILDWDLMELICEHVFRNELCVDPAEHAILVTESPFNPRVIKEKMTEVFFEVFKTPAMYMTMRNVLSLYPSGCLSGLAFSCGDTSACAVPVYEGHALPHAVSSAAVGGRDLTNFLSMLLKDKGYDLSFQLDLVQRIKENLCYVARNYNREITAPKSTLRNSYTLPDGKTITLDSERLRCPEVLFKPSLMGMTCEGIHDLILSSIIKRTDKSLNEIFFANMVLSGGCCRLRGITERLHREIQAETPCNVAIIAPLEGRPTQWVGGSILASSAPFLQMCVTREEYEEVGPTIIHRKCF